MMSLRRMPSSMATRVCRGRDRTARRRSSLSLRRIESPHSRPGEDTVQAMKLGVHIGYWCLGLSSGDQLAIVGEAERLGSDSVWTAEAYGSDAATVLGWLAGLTSTTKLGSSSFPKPAAPPGPTARE